MKQRFLAGAIFVLFQGSVFASKGSSFVCDKSVELGSSTKDAEIFAVWDKYQESLRKLNTVRSKVPKMTKKEYEWYAHQLLIWLNDQIDTIQNRNHKL